MLALMSAFEMTAFEEVTAPALPATFRGLLDHTASMTATLAAHWNGQLTALVLRHGMTADGAVLVRRVVLVTGADDLPVEIAEVRVRTAALDDGVLQRLAATTVPFGRSLHQEGISFTTEPVSFFKVMANEALAEAGRTATGTTMFGRTARLWLADGRCPLGETVEILPRV
jgi:chorismate-pyruvate lyase